MLAAAKGHDRCVKFLLDSGANVHNAYQYGWTALMLAASKGHEKCVEILLTNGANIDKMARRLGHTALMLAAENGHKKCVRLLLDYGADANIQNIYSQTALMLAAENGHKKCVKILLANEANADRKVRVFGDTALMLAAAKGHKKCVRLLLDYGADANIQNMHGQTALMLAAQNGHDKCVEILKCEESNPGCFRRLKERREEFIKGGSLSMLVALMRDYKTEMDRSDLYEDNVPQAWWKMPFEMSAWAGVKGVTNNPPVPESLDSLSPYRGWSQDCWFGTEGCQ